MLSLAAACGLPLASACSEAREPEIRMPRKTVAWRIEAANERAWRAAYDVEIAHGEVVVSVSVGLIPLPEVRRVEVEAREAEWENGVQAIWSGRFGLRVGQRVLPIRLDLSFGQPPYHHEVVVRDFAPRSDQLNWSHRAGVPIIAHEVGHMIGAFDEYRYGGTDPSEPVIDPSSLMSAGSSSGLPHARHYEAIRDSVADRLERHDIIVVALSAMD